MEDRQRLQELIKDMKCPEARKNAFDDYQIDYMARNLGIHNQGHPNLPEALSLIKKIVKSRYSKGGDDSQ